MNGSPRVVVIGSVMVDRVVAVPAIVRPGETLAASEMAIHPGGKGANQAAAAARAGAETTFVGRTGRDGEFVLETLRELGVETSNCALDEGSSGTAFLQIAPDGENAIVIVPGANARFDRDDLARAVAAIVPGDLVLLQNETAMLEETIDASVAAGAKVWLNPAPADPRVSAAALAKVDVLILNETEAAALATGKADPAAALDALCLERPAQLVVVTLGAKGAIAGHGDRRWAQAARPVEAVDTVGCGDAFIGAMAAWTVGGASVEGSLAAGCAAGSLAATVHGAIPSMPDRHAVEQVVRSMAGSLCS